MSDVEKTRTQVVTPDQSTELYPWAMNVLSYTWAVAQVAVHTTRPYDGPDVLILCSTDGLGPPDDPLAETPTPGACRYYQSVAVADGTLEGRRIDLSFTADGNEGTADLPATEATKTLSNMDFALLWAPTGALEAELTELFSYRAYEQVWSAGDRPSFAAHLLATQFAEASEVSLPDEDHKPHYDEEAPLKAEPDPSTTSDAPGDADGEEVTNPEDAQTQGPFVEPLWNGIAPVKRRPAGGSEGTETSKEEPTLEPPPGDRWIYLARHNSARPQTSPEPLGVYEATEEGAYKRARFQDDGTLSVVGEAQKQVLLPLNTPRTSDEQFLWTVYTWLSPFKVPKTRIDEVLETLPFPRPCESPGSIVPFCGGASTGPNPGLFTQPLDYPSPEQGVEGHIGSISHNLHVVFREGPAGGPGSSLYETPHLLLPHPLAVLERRVGAVERARCRFERWTEKMGGAGLLSELIGGTCHGGHGRAYLDDQLRREPKIEETTRASPATGAPVMKQAVVRSIKKKYDMEVTWAEATAPNESVDEPPADTLLAHFIYGAKRQRCYLRGRYRRAQAALRCLFRGGALVEAFVLDALRVDPMQKHNRRLIEQFFRLFPCCVAAGATGGMSALMDQAGVLRSMAKSGVPTGPLGEAADLPLAEAAGSPTFKTLFKLAQASPEFAQMLVPTLAPAVVSWAAGREVSLFEGSVDRPVPATIAAMRVHASWKPDHPGEKMALRVTEKTRETPEGRPSKRVVEVAVEGEASYQVTAVHEAPSPGSGDGASSFRKEPFPAGKGTPSAGGTPSGGEAQAPRWSMSAEGPVRAHLDRLDEDLKRMGVGLGFAGMLLGTYDAINSLRTDTFGGKEAVGVAKTVAEAGEIYADVARMASTARRLARVATAFDLVSSTIAAFEQATDADARGQAEVYDPNVLGTIGAGASALSAGALVLGVASGGMALLVGVAGAGLMWWSQWTDETEKKRSDPLWEWLPKTIWGRESTARLDSAFDLVRPGADREAPSLADPKGPRAEGQARSSSGVLMDTPSEEEQVSGLLRALRREAETFTDRGFHFPVEVSVRHAEGGEQGPVVGLDLEIALGYVSEFGTLMVDVSVNTAGFQPVPIRCAVHFVGNGDDFQYRVLPAAKTLELSGGKDATLQDHAEEERWASSHAVDYTAPTGTSGEAEALSIRVGQWPVEWNAPERRAKARKARRMHVEQDLWIDEALRAVGLHPGKNAAPSQMANYREVKRILRTVDPTSVLMAPGGLLAVLQSGQFEVSGSVYFSPLRPFQPAPQIPSSPEEAENRLLSRQPIPEYVHP